MCRDVPTSRDHNFVVPRSLDIIFGSGVSPDALLSIAGRHIAIRALTMARHTKKLANPPLRMFLKLPCSYTTIPILRGVTVQKVPLLFGQSAPTPNKSAPIRILGGDFFGSYKNKSPTSV